MYFFLRKEKIPGAVIHKEQKKWQIIRWKNCLRRRVKVDNSICDNKMMEGMNESKNEGEKCYP